MVHVAVADTLPSGHLGGLVGHRSSCGGHRVAPWVHHAQLGGVVAAPVGDGAGSQEGLGRSEGLGGSGHPGQEGLWKIRDT